MIRKLPDGIKSPTTESPRPEVCRSIIEIFSDGHIKTYGDKHWLPFIFNRPHAASVEAGIIVDDLIYEMLPWSYRELYYPGKIRQTANVQRIDVGKINEVIGNIELVNALSSIGGTKPRYRNRTDVLRALLAG